MTSRDPCRASGIARLMAEVSVSDCLYFLVLFEGFRWPRIWTLERPATGDGISDGRFGKKRKRLDSIQCKQKKQTQSRKHYARIITNQLNKWARNFIMIKTCPCNVSQC